MFTAQLDFVFLERKNYNNKKILLVKSFASEDKETQIAVTGVLQFFLFIGPDNDTDATKKTDITYWPPSKVIDPTNTEPIGPKKLLIYE